MEEPDPIPTGRLNNVRRTWDYQGGWVRAPFHEIMFNKRLTKQARLLWLWLSWVRPDSRNISWADCEETMCCGTKARRLCLSQLVQEGFVTVQEDGVVILHDPYEVYRSSHGEVITQIKREFKDFEPADDSQPSAANVGVASFDGNTTSNDGSTDSGEIMPVVVHSGEASEPIDVTNTENEITPKASKSDNDKKSEIALKIISTWNTFKPNSYSKIRTLSTKQLEAVSKHLKNLSLKQSELVDFLETVCRGIQRSDFWSNKVDQSGRNFSSVFGYGNPHDTKLKNVENLFMLGQDDPDQQDKTDALTDDQKELIKSYKYINFEFQKAKNRNNLIEITKWQENLDSINQQLREQGLFIETIELN